MARLSIPAIAPIVASLLLGAATVLGFAPFGFSALPVLTLSLLFALWRRAASPRVAAWLGFAFGLGLFGTGVSWLYLALAMFGGMAGLLAALATALFCAYLALFPALAGWATARLAGIGAPERLAAAAAFWILTEWLRSWLSLGMPWLAAGYAQTQAPLAGYAPLGGVFVVSLAVALANLVADLLTCLVDPRIRAATRRAREGSPVVRWRLRAQPQVTESTS